MRIIILVYKDNAVVDSNKAVGRDWLIWITSNSRVKIYNTFICQLTSSGVNKQLGNQIIDFVNCLNKRLKQTCHSILAKQNGITRLEGTIYKLHQLKFQNKERI